MFDTDINSRFAKERIMDEPVACFWELFIEKSKSYDIKPTAVKWDAVLPSNIKAHPNERLALHTPARVDHDLRLLVERSRLKAWHCRQASVAIQLLFVERAKAAKVNWRSASSGFRKNRAACRWCYPGRKYRVCCKTSRPTVTSPFD